MPPPAAKRSRTNKKILDEESYQAGVAKIIQRDYFPDLPKLRAQAEWLEALGTRDPQVIAEARVKILSEQRKFGCTPTPQASASSSTPVSMPLAGGWEPQAASSADREYAIDADAANSTVADTNMTLGQFQARNTSEDNASFLEIQEKDLEKHREKFSWIYETEANHLLLLPDGTKITDEQRLLMDKACASKRTRGDDRRGAIAQWNYRTRNQLLFYPDLNTSRETCGLKKLTDQQQQDVKMLTDGAHSARHILQMARAPKEINRTNTRLSGAFLQSEANAASKSSSGGVTHRYNAAPEGPSETGPFVAMTPIIEPGAVGASPLTTWGDIDGTPLVLDPTATPMVFQVPAMPTKEVSAHKLELESRRKRAVRSGSTPQLTQRGTPGGRRPPASPLVRKGSKKRKSMHTSSRATPTRQLTPAARSFAERLHKGKQSKMFGDTSQLRSSYANKRTQRPRPSAATPTSAQLRASNEPKQRNGGSCLTDGLLNF
jgi:protein DGCR14